ncbi:MAG TPA: PBSX family phage terminase large subunit [bacterium]|nr:PBSX family phage terminase large subunit [Bacilli bacterium]HQM85625.1 PBSX family phage terminase large subunit [bacterium]
MSIIPFTITRKVFNPVFLKYLDIQKRYRLFYGGAGSGKSVFVAQEILIKLFQGGHNILVVRQTSKSNRQSTFALLKQIISKWNIPKDWISINKTEMTITNTVNGSQIAFAGLDDVEKLKSITFENGILTDIWIEEASEVSEKDFNQLDLRLRGLASVPMTITMTYNPIDVNFWAKKRFFDRVNDDCLICKTTYLDNRFIDEQYKKTLERLKEIDEVYYNVYALGEWGVLGNQIYHNYKIYDFDVNDPKFKDVCIGVDFGFNAPSSALKCAFYDNEIYILDEIYQSGLTNSELIEEIKKQMTTGFHVIADCAEPDRIEEFKRSGFWIDACSKGDGSIKSGIDWLKAHKIHVHLSNCPETARELHSYKYREDKDGNVLDMPVKFNDHAMDALRYAVEYWRSNYNVQFSFDSVESYEYETQKWY